MTRRIARAPAPTASAALRDAFRAGHDGGRGLPSSPRIDPWFLRADRRDRWRWRSGSAAPEHGQRAARTTLRWTLKQHRLLRPPLAELAGGHGGGGPQARRVGSGGSAPVYKLVDTCAAEFEAYTPYLYSTYERGVTRPRRTDRQEDRSSWAAAPTASARASSSTTAACTPPSPCARTASRPSWSTATRRRSRTDYDTSDRLYFEPLTLEDVLEHRAQREKPRRRDRAVRRPDAAEAGGAAAEARACRSSAPSPDAIDRAEDRERFARAARQARPRASRRTASRRTRRRGPARSPSGSATRCWCGPRYVLGGRAMEIVYDDDEPCSGYMARGRARPRRSGPVLIDQFLEDAIEVDVDARRRRHRRGRSAASWSTSRRPASTRATRPASLPPYSLGAEHRSTRSSDRPGRWRASWAWSA